MLGIVYNSIWAATKRRYAQPISWIDMGFEVKRHSRHFTLKWKCVSQISFRHSIANNRLSLWELNSLVAAGIRNKFYAIQARQLSGLVVLYFRMIEKFGPFVSLNSGTLCADYEAEGLSDVLW